MLKFYFSEEARKPRRLADWLHFSTVPPAVDASQEMRLQVPILGNGLFSTKCVSGADVRFIGRIMVGPVLKRRRVFWSCCLHPCHQVCCAFHGLFVLCEFHGSRDAFGTFSVFGFESSVIVVLLIFSTMHCTVMLRPSAFRIAFVVTLALRSFIGFCIAWLHCALEWTS